MKHFWAGFEKRAVDRKSLREEATNMSHEELVRQYVGAVDENTKHWDNAKNSRSKSKKLMLGLALGLPAAGAAGYLFGRKKEAANNRLFASGGMKALNRGSSINGTMTARPTTLKATVGRTDPPQIPSAAAHTPKPAVPAPPHAPVKVPTIKAKGVTGMAV